VAKSVKKDAVFDAIVKKLKAEFKLSRLYLFGSRGRGEGQRDSDYDIVAIVPNSKLSRFKREVEARVALKDVPAAIDFCLY
jgi:predicted nucleotidyltransferase